VANHILNEEFDDEFEEIEVIEVMEVIEVIVAFLEVPKARYEEEKWEDI
jgi:hypothetical protein